VRARLLRLAGLGLDGAGQHLSRRRELGPAAIIDKRGMLHV
jgi:hypothetical protein